MDMAKGYKRFSQKEFNTIKELQKLGLKRNRIATVTGRSFLVVNAAYNSSTIEEYRKFMEDYNHRHDLPRVDDDNRVDVIPAEVVGAIEEEDQLTRIADALERMVEVIDKRRTLF
jgi:hypothetical protein